MSPSSSHPISLADYEANETKTIDAECLTASTIVDPNSGVDDCTNANTCNNNSRSCSRCGSINSNKSAIVISNHDNEFNYDHLPSYATMQRKCCASSSRIDAMSDVESNCYLTTETLSRRSSVGHLARHRMHSYGSNTSLSCRSSTPGTSNGHYPRRHHHKHSHSHQRQIYYQKHHTLCKHVSDMSSSHQTTSSGTHSMPRSHCRHRRKNSCSSMFDESLRRRKRADVETCSFHGSDASIYDPLHVDVNGGGGGASSANTVVLTPSKITIEHNHDTDVEEVAIDVGKANRNVYTPSPIQWSFLPDFDQNRKMKPCRMTNDNEITCEIDADCMAMGNDFCCTKSSCPQRCQQATDDYPIWQTRNDHNGETTNTIMFHHESKEFDNCSGNYGQNSIPLTSLSTNDASGTNNPTSTDDENPNCIQFSPTSPTVATKSLLRRSNTKESLNNAMSTNCGNQSQSTTATTPVIHFQKNDISSSSQRRLDLSPEIRRYSKMTNLEQQNAANLMPNYFQGHVATSDSPRSSSNPANQSKNQNLGSNYFSDNKFTSATTSSTTMTTATAQPSPAAPPPPPCVHQNQLNRTVRSNSSTSHAATSRDVELQNLPTASVYEKPFGSINLTTQNQFEPYSSRRTVTTTESTIASTSQSAQRNGSNINAISYPPNASNFDGIVDNTNQLPINTVADNANNNFNYSNATSSSESLVSDRQNDDDYDNDDDNAIGGNRQATHFNGIFRAIRKRARKYTKFLKDTH